MLVKKDILYVLILLRISTHVLYWCNRGQQNLSGITNENAKIYVMMLISIDHNQLESCCLMACQLADIELEEW